MFAVGLDTILKALICAINHYWYCVYYTVCQCILTSTFWCVQKEVTAVLLEGDKGGEQLEGVAMKGTIAKRFEELDWDNNGAALQIIRLFAFSPCVSCLIR